MRVLMIIHYPVFGGPHMQAVRLAPALKKHGWDMVVVLPSEPGNAVGVLRDEGIEVVTMPLHRLRGTADLRDHVRFGAALWREVRAIQELIKRLDIDVIHVSGLVSLHGALAGRRNGAPVVWQLMDTRAPVALRRLLMPLVLRWSDVVMSTGAAVARAHPGWERLGERLRTFYMPVDLDDFTPEAADRTAARATLGLAEEDLVIGTVGNLNPQKGHDFLLRAAARVRIDLGPVKTLIVGSSHDTHRAHEQRLYRLSASLGLEVGTDVVFTGGLRDVRPALAAMDVFALSSVPRSEGAPAAVQEAMSMSLPVVATAVGALEEIVDHGATGLLVPPLDADALADAIMVLLRDPEQRKAMGVRARECLGRFSTERCAAIHAEAYEFARDRRTSSPLAPAG